MTSEDPQSVIRDRRLTPEEAVRYRRIREQIESEKPEINARIRARLAELKELASVFEELRKAREEQSLSLGDIQERTGIDRSALSNLETGQRPDYTLEMVLRYADAVGKRVAFALTDKPA